MNDPAVSASLRRRLAFAGGSYYVFDRLFCQRPLDRISRIGDSQTARIPDHLARLGFRKLVAIAFRWHPLYVAELARASRHYGIEIVPSNCPREFAGCPHRMFALPDPLDSATLYVVHSGLMTPAFRYLDNKWYTSK